MKHRAIARIRDLISPESQQVLNMSVEEARRLLLGDPAAVARIRGSFALVAREEERVCLARSLSRPMRYFLAKEADGPMLVVADRIDAILGALREEGYADQFHPTYTRMVPAHHVTEIRLLGCPDPNPSYLRFFDPPRGTLPPDVDLIGRRYVEALLDEVRTWLAHLPSRAPIGVLFSGGIDSGSVLLAAYRELLALGKSPARLKAFTLSVDGGGSDLAVDGDGGDENLKDYPIEENAELTIRSVVNNSTLYQEGWGVDAIKHSLTYTGGLSRGCVRGYAPARSYGFSLFSPYTSPRVVAVAEAIPFDALIRGSHEALYGLKGKVVASGMRQLLGVEFPVFPKRRFQHGAAPEGVVRQLFRQSEGRYRSHFLRLYEPTWRSESDARFNNPLDSLPEATQTAR